MKVGIKGVDTLMKHNKEEMEKRRNLLIGLAEKLKKLKKKISI